MTRFALIPLAFFANACASAEEVQDLVEETTEEVREGIDSYDAETDRSTRTRNKAMLSYAKREFRNEMAERDCDLVGAVQGNWRDRSFRLDMTVINTNADTIAKLEGALQYDANNTGEIWAKGRTIGNNTMGLEGDWVNNAIEAVLFTAGAANSDRTVFAKKIHRGLGGKMIGAVAICNK
jgi:hypothetical protein